VVIGHQCPLLGIIILISQELTIVAEHTQRAMGSACNSKTTTQLQ
jgi:hypothetical protein